MSDSSATSGSGNKDKDYTSTPYNYDNDKERSFNNSRPPMFTGEAEKFPWWKSKLYSHIIGIDDELFKMIEDGTIDSMYSRFQTLVSGLQVLKKSYTTADHVKKILRSLPAKWRPKVTTIEEARDLNALSLENLISSLKCHEIGFPEAESSKKSNIIALESKSKEAKALKVAESEGEPSDEEPEDSEAEELALLTRRLQRLTGKNKKFFRSYGSKGSGSNKEEQKNCYNCKGQSQEEQFQVKKVQEEFQE